ncbi:MAG: ATP-binding cassette domain-containing protein [Bacteroidetes bacterium]|nr:ATP-binding cassette domain-containing protein [Bacteroidota bacterium]
MIQIQLQSAGKQFQKQWVFRNLELHIQDAEKIAIIGLNGSGKSTLLQIISGFQSLSEGTIQFSFDGKTVPIDQWYHQIAYAAPYIDLPEEYNIKELLSFYSSFKPFQNKLGIPEVIEIMQLGNSNNKAIKHFSSGMKQRLKLSMAILSNTPVLLLDEPLSNLDKNGHLWYHTLIEEYAKQKTIIVCSNHIEEEIIFCTSKIDIHNFKS